MYRDRGLLEKPESYHRTPPPLAEVDLRPGRVRGIDYEHLRFESGYEPHEGEPGRDRWLSYAPPRTGHAWVKRHAGAERPWLICIHGYQMGSPLVDFGAFRPEWLHHRLGPESAAAGAAAARPAQDPPHLGRRLPRRRSARHGPRAGADGVGSAPPRLVDARAGCDADRRLRALARRLQHGAALVLRGATSPARSPGFPRPTSRVSRGATVRPIRCARPRRPASGSARR